MRPPTLPPRTIEQEYVRGPNQEKPPVREDTTLDWGSKNLALGRPTGLVGHRVHTGGYTAAG